MARFLIFISLVSLNVASAQTTTTELIDSLNFAKSPKEKVDLSQRIAMQMKDSDWNRALSYLELAKDETAKLDNPQQELAAVYLTTARMYNAKDVLDVAIEYYQKASKLFRDAGNTEEEMKIENNLAIIYARLENNDRALLFFRKVYDYQFQQGDSLRQAQVLNNIGTLYLESQPDSALFYYIKSLSLAPNLHNYELSTYIYNNLARVYVPINDSLARAYFRKAQYYAQFTDDKSTRSLVSQSLATYYSGIQAYDSAIYYANRTLDLEEGTPYGFTTQKAIHILYESYLARENYKAASTYFEQYNTIRDSLNVTDAAVQLERLKLQQEYASRARIQKLDQERTRFRYYIIGLILLVSILILLLIVARYRNRMIRNALEKDLLETRQKELRHDLDVKNQVMVARAMAGMQQMDIITATLTDLKKLRLKLDKKSNQFAIDQIVNRLKRDLKTDTWQEFELSFAQVHNSFYTNLTKRHPDLTPKDRRLCVLLFLDLSSKEISQITGQSYKSIENARTRLRKKLDLTNEKVNLSTYLITLE